MVRVREEEVAPSDEASSCTSKNNGAAAEEEQQQPPPRGDHDQWPTEPGWFCQGFPLSVRACAGGGGGNGDGGSDVSDDRAPEPERITTHREQWEDSNRVGGSDPINSKPPPRHWGQPVDTTDFPPSSSLASPSLTSTTPTPTTTESCESKRSCPYYLTEDPPPGADHIVAWYAREPLRGPWRGDDDDDPSDLGDSAAVEECGADERAALLAVQRFMGPSDGDDALHREIRRLRRRQRRGVADGSTSGPTRRQYELVSYRQLDSPVWHHYTLAVRQGRTPPSIPGRIRRAIAKAACTRPCQGTTANTRGIEDPMREFQLDTRMLTRVVIATIGFVMSIVGFCVSASSIKLLDAKIAWVTGMGEGGLGFVAFTASNVVLALLAHVPVSYRPVSAGSGIAEAKAVLNGVLVPCCTELVSALCKAVSVVFSGAASLPVGLEGPLIYMGLCVGESSQRAIPKSYPTLKTDRFRRDFAAVGTASGVTAAFFTPIGGVLFAMEEGSSFWSVLLTWQCFAAACVTVIFSYLWVLMMDDALFRPFTVSSLGKFNGLPGISSSEFVPPITFHFYAYFLFAFMGLCGGLLGALWNEANRALAVGRARCNLSRGIKVLELLLWVILTSCLVWWLPQAYQVCGDMDATRAATTYFRQFGCPEGEYNHLATLLLNPPGEVSINLLFWERPEAFSLGTCLIAAAVYLIMLLLLFGTPISMGIFIPLLFVGACLGRALGMVLEMGEQTRTYAVVGAVAMLCGVTRILISLTIIMMTATGVPYFVSAFMVATICARVAGKWAFGRDGIYEMILDLKEIPFVGSQPPQSVQHRGLEAQDIMSGDFITLRPEERVRFLLETLRTHAHLDFAVVDSDGLLIGIIARTELLVLLSYSDILYPQPGISDHPKAIRHEELLHRHHGAPTLESVEARLPHELQEWYLDLSPYVSLAHYQFHAHGSCERAFELIRTLGLRTLVVTGHSGKPIGTITRYDLKMLEEVNLIGRSKHELEYKQSLNSEAFAYDSIS